DPSSSVRIEAIQTLSKLRPVNERAGWALEQATQDSNLRVQWQARSALLQYRMSGYRQGSGGPADRPLRTDEPPLAPPLPASSSTGTIINPVQRPRNVAPPTRPIPIYTEPGAFPLPRGEEQTAPPPSRMVVPPPPAPPAPKVDEGPTLVAPK
ncbi:MAG: HEAT repeat domain-containing protein, partial [Gemmataceae bacterium]